MWKKCVPVMALTVILTGSAWAQTAVLFDTVGSDSTGGAPPPTVFAAYPVTMTLAAVEVNPAVVEVRIPLVGDVSFDRKVFETEEGFDEADAPLPGADLTYRWVGRTPAGGLLSLGIYRGTLSAWIWHDGEFYTVRKFGGSPHLVHNDIAALPDDDATPAPTVLRLAQDLQPLDHLTLTDLYQPKPSPKIVGLANLDILYIVTDQAVQDAGGTSELISLVQEAFGKTNEVFDSSGARVRFHMKRILRLDDFTPTGNPRDDRNALRIDPVITQARDDFDADIVSIIVRNGELGGLFPLCGQAYTQRPGCSDPDEPPILGCGPGPSFSEHAYHLVAVNCLSGLTGIHEILHNMGGEHNRASAVPEAAAAYTFSFGYVDLGLFRTILALSSEDLVPYVATPRVLEPSTLHPLGVVGTNDVVSTVNLLAYHMEFYRGLPSATIMVCDFETGGTHCWSSVEP